MKTIALALLVFISQVEMSAQMITLQMDTCQFFEHPVLMSTMDAAQSGQLVYTKLFAYDNFLVTFDLNRMKSFTHGDNENTIAQINPSSNVLDLIIEEKERTSLVIYGATDDGGMIYLYEYKEGDLMKGYFCNTPKIIPSENTPDEESK
jgi:hypothetical protein